MKCLRKTIKKTREDQVRNEILRHKLGTTPVKNYLAQTFRNPEQPAARANNTKTSGYKAPGRPRKRWIDGVKDNKETT